MTVKLIVAMSNNNGIGYQNKIPWHNKLDLQHFKKTTIGNGNNSIIMGKNTFNSIGKKLPNRYNIIVSTTLKDNKLHIVDSIEKAIQQSTQLYHDDIWIIGGEKIYQYVIEKHLVSELWITYIPETYTCDRFFPDIPDNFEIKERFNLGSTLNVVVYKEK